MAEVEIAGAKIKGGKILLILPILGTLGGGLWGGFEFYKDYELRFAVNGNKLSGYVDGKLLIETQDIVFQKFLSLLLKVLSMYL